MFYLSILGLFLLIFSLAFILRVLLEVRVFLLEQGLKVLLWGLKREIFLCRVYHRKLPSSTLKRLSERGLAIEKMRTETSER